VRLAEARRICRHEQRGAALILFATILILGVAWFTVGALGKAAPTTAEREIKTGLALQQAKQALLAYVALKAADSNEKTPGRLPCPESLGQPGTSAEGIAAPVVSPSFPTCSAVGRLPWKTLGIDQLRDGYGEPLWYAVPTGTWALITSSTTLTINPGLANQLMHDSVPSAVVAVIIAPGNAVNTLSDPGTPVLPCAKVNQQTNRYAVPYVVPNFLECGNASGSNYTTAGTVPWSNDRTISITAAEVMDTIAGAVADRLQRHVAPALNDWRTTESFTNWGTSFLPFAQPFGNPVSANMCGSFGIPEGQTPVALSSANCTRWSTANTSLVAGLANLGCGVPSATSVQCSFQNLLATPPFSARITATAPNGAGGFRRFALSDLTISDGGTASGLVNSISGATGAATTQFDVTWPAGLGLLAVVTVTIPHPPDAALLSDSRMTWFMNNNWGPYTYYTVAQGAALGAASPCSGAADPDCLTVSGLPASNGNADDKRFVLTLMGGALAGLGQSQPSGNTTDYLESHAVGTAIHVAATVTSTFNDRLATCPFQQTPASGTPTSICN